MEENGYKKIQRISNFHLYFLLFIQYFSISFVYIFGNKRLNLQNVVHSLNSTSLYVCKGIELLEVLDVTFLLVSAICRLDVLLPSLLDTTNGEMETDNEDDATGEGEIAENDTN